MFSQVIPNTLLSLLKVKQPFIYSRIDPEHYLFNYYLKQVVSSLGNLGLVRASLPRCGCGSDIDNGMDMPI